MYLANLLSTFSKNNYSKTNVKRTFTSCVANKFYRLVSKLQSISSFPKVALLFLYFVAEANGNGSAFAIFPMMTSCAFDLGAGSSLFSLLLHFLSLLSRFRDASTGTRNIKEFLNKELRYRRALYLKRKENIF